MFKKVIILNLLNYYYFIFYFLFFIIFFFSYKSRDEFCADVRQMFINCEVFNEDDSPVGKAGHAMRNFFESRWMEITGTPLPPPPPPSSSQTHS